MPPRCYVIENYPDGIYFTDTTLDYEDVANAEGQLDSAVEEFKAWAKDKPAVEVLVKFTNARGEQAFVDFMAFKKGDRFFLAAIDQRDCGA